MALNQLTKFLITNSTVLNSTYEYNLDAAIRYIAITFRISAFRALCARPQAYYFATTFSFDISISMRRNCTLSSCIRIRIYGRSKQLRSFIRLRLPPMRPPRNAPFHINHRVLSFAETSNYQRSRSLRFMRACLMCFLF